MSFKATTAALDGCNKLGGGSGTGDARGESCSLGDEPPEDEGVREPLGERRGEGSGKSSFSSSSAIGDALRFGSGAAPVGVVVE